MPNVQGRILLFEPDPGAGCQRTLLPCRVLRHSCACSKCDFSLLRGYDIPSSTRHIVCEQKVPDRIDLAVYLKQVRTTSCLAHKLALTHHARKGLPFRLWGWTGHMERKASLSMECSQEIVVKGVDNVRVVELTGCVRTSPLDQPFPILWVVDDEIPP